MKTILGIVLTLTIFASNAQQKLIGTSVTQYHQTGTIQAIDSNEYIYNSWNGSLFSNEPEFSFDTYSFDWNYIKPAIKWDFENQYFGTSLPLSIISSRNNTIVGGNVTLSESVAGNDRREYAYDGAGNLVSEKYYYFNGSVLDLTTEKIYEFDANNNKILEKYIEYNGGSQVWSSIDSLSYDGTNNLTRYRRFNPINSNTYYLQLECLLTYAGTEISNIELHQAPNNISPLEWIFDIDYVFSGGQPSTVLYYNVIGGVPDTIVYAMFDYSYGLNNKISLYESFEYGTLMDHIEYSYDGQGFITEIENSEMDASTSMLYTTVKFNYYYQSTAGLEEVEIAEATVFPNPSSDFVTISARSEIEKVSVFNANGAIMISQNGGDIDISNLPTGVYLAKVKTATGVAQARFVKQ